MDVLVDKAGHNGIAAQVVYLLVLHAAGFGYLFNLFAIDQKVGVDHIEVIVYDFCIF